MRPPVDMNKALTETREKTDAVRRQMGYNPTKRNRVKTRSAGESLALCRAVCEAVQKAKQEGRFVKLEPIGYLIRWEK